MRVTVRCIDPSMADALGGRDRLEVDLEGATLSDLLEVLRAMDGGLLGSVLWDEQGRPDPGVQVFVNGDRWVGLLDTSHPLRDGDEVRFTRMLAGG